MDPLGDEPKIRPPDLYRETPVRYLGYANEVGEAFRAQIGRNWVNFTYAIATAYVLADTTDKTLKTYRTKGVSEKDRTKNTVYILIDTLMWQMMASVVIPGFTINRICKYTSLALEKSQKLPKNSRKWVVTGLGLAVIPFIVKPIDHFVDQVLDNSLRRVK